MDLRKKLRSNIDGLLELADQFSFFDFEFWNEERDPVICPDARCLYLDKFHRLDGSIEALVSELGIAVPAPAAELIGYGRVSYGITTLLVGLEGVPLMDEWRQRLIRFKAMVEAVTCTAEDVGPPKGLNRSPDSRIVTIRKLHLRIALGICERTLASRIKNGEITLAKAAKQYAKIVEIDLNQFDASTREKVLRKLGLDS